MEGSISGVSMAISSGWNRLILEALREGRTLIVPALPACQAGTGYTHHPFNAFLSFQLQWHHMQVLDFYEKQSKLFVMTYIITISAV